MRTDLREPNLRGCNVSKDPWLLGGYDLESPFEPSGRQRLRTAVSFSYNIEMRDNCGK